jgi:hypothetical protein
MVQTTIATIIGYVVLFGLAALGLAILIGIINDSITFNVTFGKGLRFLPISPPMISAPFRISRI